MNPEQVIKLCMNIQNNVSSLEALYANIRDEIHLLNDTMVGSARAESITQMVDEAFFHSLETMNYMRKHTDNIIGDMYLIIDDTTPLAPIISP